MSTTSIVKESPLDRPSADTDPRSITVSQVAASCEISGENPILVLGEYLDGMRTTYVQ